MSDELKLSPKSPEIENFLETMFGRTTAIEKKVCVFCGKEVTKQSFRDAISVKEYTISGLCQECQDKIFK